MANIFISYNRQSEVIAKALAEDIEALGHTAWFDQDLSGGQAWWAQIIGNVRSCDIFVFVLDPDSLNSTACKREYGYAADLGKPILPVLASEGVSTNLLPPALSHIQFVDYRKQDRNAAFRLARALTSIPPPKPLPDPLPDPPEAPISYLGNLTSQVGTTSILSYEEQSALVFDLKRGLQDPGTTEDTRTLLQRLRKRRDVFATIADEIDELLGSRRKLSEAPPEASEITSSFQIKSPKEEKSSTSSDSGTSERQKPQNPVNQSIQQSRDHRFTARARSKAAFLLAVVGVALGVLAVGFILMKLGYGWRLGITTTSWFFGLSGAIAGAISGMDRGRIVGALVGMIGSLICVTFIVYSGMVMTLMASLLAPLGAMLGGYFKNPKKHTLL